jgi:hypothetical protein
LNTNQKITIKVSGEKSAVLKTLKKIESVFPLFIEGKINENDAVGEAHVFLTVACVDQEA